MDFQSYSNLATKSCSKERAPEIKNGFKTTKSRLSRSISFGVPFFEPTIFKHPQLGAKNEQTIGKSISGNLTWLAKWSFKNKHWISGTFDRYVRIFFRKGRTRHHPLGPQWNPLFLRCCYQYCWWIDGRNPAPVDMENIPSLTKVLYIQVVSRISSINLHLKIFHMDSEIPRHSHKNYHGG